MKTVLHFPTEQYGFAEIELEVDSVQEALEAYQTAKNAPTSVEKLPTKEWNAFMDTWLSTGKPGALEVWERMDDTQKYIVNEVKKSLLRINAKNK